MLTDAGVRLGQLQCVCTAPSVEIQYTTLRDRCDPPVTGTGCNHTFRAMTHISGNMDLRSTLLNTRFIGYVNLARALALSAG